MRGRAHRRALPAAQPGRATSRSRRNVALAQRLGAGAGPPPGAAEVLERCGISRPRPRAARPALGRRAGPRRAGGGAGQRPRRDPRRRADRRARRAPPRSASSQLLRERAADGAAVLIVTHSPEVAAGRRPRDPPARRAGGRHDRDAVSRWCAARAPARTYGPGAAATVALQPTDCSVAAGSAHRARRPVGLGQVDAAAPDGRARRPDRRARSRWPAHRRRVRRCARTGRGDLPGPEPAAAADGRARTWRCRWSWPAHRRADAQRAAPAPRSSSSTSLELRRQAARGDLRRPGAARRRRPRARRPAAADPRRRADRPARPRQRRGRRRRPARRRRPRRRRPGRLHPRPDGRRAPPAALGDAQRSPDHAGTEEAAWSR